MSASEQNQANENPLRWTSRFGFLMAAIGAAVGLGNLWRFPFQTGQNGGAAFVLIYLFAVIFIAWPVIVGEIAIGRRKRMSAIGSTSALARDAGSTPLWGVIGVVAIAINLLVLTTYANIAGRILAYSLMAFGGEFSGDGSGETLPLYNGPLQAGFWFSTFLVVTVVVVAGGLRGGIERLVTILMPIFFILLASLSVYALVEGEAGKAVSYLFKPDFAALTPEIVLAALGQAFFSVAAGAGAMLTYGAYLERSDSIEQNAGIIVGADTLVAIVAGLMIFPIVFAHGLDPAAGMGLIFQALPVTFAGMPAGHFIGGAFFFLAFIAALTTSISMIFIPAVYLEERLGWSHARSAIILGSLVWIVGMAATIIEGAPELIDFWAGSVLLPVGGLLVSIFVGWVVPRAMLRDELSGASALLFSLWRFLVRYVAPLAIASILLFGLSGSH